MNQKRPIHLNPLAIRLPISAWISITHRISGILVFLLIPFLLWSLGTALASPEGLSQVKDIWGGGLGRILGWGLFVAIGFHLLAGMRHMIMDLHFGDSHQGGKFGAWLVLILFVMLLAAAFWFWG